MPYFEDTAGTPERIGKVIGNILSALIYVSIFGLMLLWYLP